MKVSRRKKSYYVQKERRSFHVSKSRIRRTVFRHTGNRKYLIQKGIRLIRVKGRAIDYRLLMLKPGSKWEFMGIIGKMATGNRVVTNFNNGGEPIGLSKSLRSIGWNEADIRRIRKEMRSLGFATARQFNRKFKNCRRLGIDLAIDTNKKIWIIEVNTNPFYDLFKHHQDRGRYRKVDRYMKRIRRLQSDR